MRKPYFKNIRQIRPIHQKSSITIMIIALAVLFSANTLTAAKTSACDYIPTWLINVNSGSYHKSAYFHDWYEEEAMLSYVEAQTNPNNRLAMVTISPGALCLDNGQVIDTTPPPNFTSTQSQDVNSLTPTWTVSVTTNGATTYKYYHDWYQRFAMLDFVTQNSDPFPQYGVSWNYVVITDGWRSN